MLFEDIKESGQSVEEHIRKLVEMHCLAHNFSLQLKEKVEYEGLEEFGVVLEYKNVYMGQTDDGEYVTVEEFIDAYFVKYINNDGFVCYKHHQVRRKAHCA